MSKRNQDQFYSVLAQTPLMFLREIEKIEWVLENGESGNILAKPT